MKRALEKNPEARYASGAELASALASVPRAAAPRRAVTRRWLAVGAAAVVWLPSSVDGSFTNRAGSIGLVARASRKSRGCSRQTRDSRRSTLHSGSGR